MRRVLLLALLPLAAGCGAGVIGGVFASNRRSGTPEVRAITVDKPWMAYFGQEGEGRFVTLTGFEAPAMARVRVAVRIPSVVDRRGGLELPYLDWEQPNAQIFEVRSNVTRIVFPLNTTALAETLIAAGLDLALADVAAQLVVQVDGADVVPPTPFLIHRLMQATLVPSRTGATEELVSVAGGTEFTCRLRGHPAAADTFEIDLATFDPARRGSVLQQRISNVRVEPVAGTGDLLLRATAPANPFPCRLFAAVRHVQAGLSTPIEPLYYAPDIGFVAPGAVATDGGTRTLAVGTGLVALSFFGEQTVAEPDYDRIELWVEKGGRRAQIPPASIQRRPASLSRVSFDMPASPDGRPGRAALIVRVDLREAQTGGAVVEARAEGLVAYGDNAPSFGLRGVRLPTRAQHVALGHVEDGTGAFDAVACSGSLPNVHLFVSSDNGMLRRFGAPWIAGATSELSERWPQRLLVQDLDGDARNDVLVLNGGDGVIASHTILVGKAPPGAPLLAGGAVMRAAASTATIAQGDIDHNGMVDLVVVPPVDSKLPPEVCLSFGGAGAARFVVMPLTQVVEPYEAIELADLDMDGALDISLARGGNDPGFATLYGRGDGSFAAGQAVALDQIPGYTPTSESRAVGLHAIGDARLRGLAIVLGGHYRQETQASIVVLDQVGPRQHQPPSPERVLAYGVSQSFVRSITADLDEDGVVELVVAGQATTREADLHVFAWRESLGEPAFVELLQAVDLGAEPMLSISTIGFGPATGGHLAARNAVFVTHSFLFSDEDRISTLLVDRSQGGLRLRPPDGTRQLPHTIDGVALGRFRGAATPAGALDVVLASNGGSSSLRGLQFMANDGVGVLVPGVSVEHPLLPGSVAVLPRADGDRALFLDANRRLGVVHPASNRPTDPLTLAFDPYLPPALRALPLLDDSKLAVGDVDGDGLHDVVALLVFPSGGAPTEVFGQLLLLLGRDASAGELPFTVPDPAVVGSAPAHGSARDLVLADFAADPRLPARLEVAVSVAGTVNHVRFYALDRPQDPPEQRGLRRSFRSAAEPFLIAGDGPERLAAMDIDADGIVDLAVASATDRQLRVFSSSSQPTEEVDIAAFRQLPIGLVTLPEGALRHLVLRDLNGDSVIDILVTAVESLLGPIATVRYHLGTGTGQFGNPVVLPSIRIGDQRWTSQGLIRRQAQIAMAVGELNSDDAVDLAIGWATFGPDDRNLYLLFGGTR